MTITNMHETDTIWKELELIGCLHTDSIPLSFRNTKIYNATHDFQRPLE